MSWKAVILALFGMGMVIAVAHPSSIETPEPAPAKLRTIYVDRPTPQPDGYMSEEQCATVQTGMPVADLVWKYGWPASDYGISAFSDRLFYPVHDAGDDRCVIRYDDNKVVSTLYRDE